MLLLETMMLVYYYESVPLISVWFKDIVCFKWYGEKNMLSSFQRCTRYVYWGDTGNKTEVVESGSKWEKAHATAGLLRLTFSEGRCIAAARRKFLHHSTAWEHVAVAGIYFPARLCNSNIICCWSFICRCRNFLTYFHLKALHRLGLPSIRTNELTMTVKLSTKNTIG